MKYLSLFSGIGGFEKGIEQSGKKLECIGYSEIDKYAKSIYTRHFPRHRCFGDVNEINTEDLPEFDLLVGGFPCQSFSVAGKRGGFDDTRGTLFFEIARILKDKRPKYFLLENVKGLLYHDKGKTFKRILEVLADLGYDVKWEVLNSKDFGVPQNRNRIFIKGYSSERCGGEILYQPKDNEPSNEHSADRQLIKMNRIVGQGNKVYNINGVSTTLCANAGGLGGKTGMYAIPTTKQGELMCVTTKPRQTSIKKYQDNYVLETDKYLEEDFRLNFNDNFRVRKLTPIECERLQGFEDDYTKYGKDGELISDTQRYKCLGNAVTTNVVEYIFRNWEGIE